MRLQIVPMEQAHLEQVAVLEARCFSVPWSRAMLEADMLRENTVYRTALSPDGAVVGYAGFDTVLDEGCITNVAAAPECRRQGIGGLLVQSLLQEGRSWGLAFLTLEVRAGNAPAIALYEKYGFQIMGRRTFYYDKPREDALLMTFFYGDEKEGSL